MRLEWSPLALADRDTIFDFIGRSSPRAAALVDEQIAGQVGLLLRFPELGRHGRVAGTRELVISHTPFVVAYRVEEDAGRGAIRVLRVLHGAQRWPGEAAGRAG